MQAPLDIQELRRETESLDAAGLLAWSACRFAGKVALATSLGAEDQVLTNMLASVVPPVPIFTLDTGRLPQQTHDVLDATRRRYNLTVEILCPQASQVEAMVRQHGTNLFYQSVENRILCCQVRKVIPLRHKLSQLDAWICGLRREQAVSRAMLERVEWDESNGLVKINPLANWTNDQVWAYIREHRVPYNALHDAGYPSIGCAPCTRAVAPGQDIRAGRWWWERAEHKECGLHRRQVSLGS